MKHWKPLLKNIKKINKEFKNHRKEYEKKDGMVDLIMKNEKGLKIYCDEKKKKG